MFVCSFNLGSSKNVHNYHVVWWLKESVKQRKLRDLSNKRKMSSYKNFTKKPVLGKIGTIPKDQDVAPAVEHQFFYFRWLVWLLRRKHVAFLFMLSEYSYWYSKQNWSFFLSARRTTLCCTYTFHPSLRNVEAFPTKLTFSFLFLVCIYCQSHSKLCQPMAKMETTHSFLNIFL
jgi:hypothetical protein